jgi:hypothetical protein
MHQQIKRVLTLALFLLAVSMPVEAKLDIAEMPYLYRYQYARGLLAPTFVICGAGSYQPLKKALSPGITITASVTSEAVGKKTVYFARDSAEVTHEAKAVLDSISIDVPVSVTGYTCPLGTPEHNQRLAEKRARAVADYLCRRGLTITSAHGKGGCCFVNCDLKKNRRVVIQPKTSEQQEQGGFDAPD